ncbi:MAG TPA: hypothetical protein VII99_10330, partial [Bacteroidia bacterium]
HSKDIFKWWEAIRDFSPTKMAKNFSDASNPLWAMIQETITRTNWKGQDINPTNDVQKTIWRTAQNLASHFIPITIQQYLQGHPKGSKFNIVTDIMGLRPARKAEGQPELSAVQEVQGRLSDARRTLASDKGIQRNYPTPSNAAKVKQDQQDIHEILQQLSKARQEYNKTKGPDKYVGTQIP